MSIRCLNRNYNIIRNSFISCYDEEIKRINNFDK